MSNTQYEPGAVVYAEFNDGSGGERAIRTVSGWHGERGPIYPAGERAFTFHPLVTLDLSDIPGVLATLHDSLAHMYVGQPNALRLQDLIRQIEAQTKPPRIPEPTGLGAVVEDAAGNYWVRSRAPFGKWHSGHGFPVEWDKFDAVRVLSEGVQP